MKSSIILKEGITGKQHVASKRATNNNVKSENCSISFCIKQVLKHDESFLKSINGYQASDINPANLLPLLQGKEATNSKFTAWLVMTLVKRFYVSKEASKTIAASTSVVTTKVIAKGTKAKVKATKLVTA
jgi:hypothetical protein